MPWNTMDSVTELMPHRVQVFKHSGYDRYGQPIYTGSDWLPCLITGEQKLVRAVDGTQQVTSSVVYCYAPELTVTPDNKVGFQDGRQFPVLAVSTDTDETGVPYAVTIYLGAG